MDISTRRFDEDFLVYDIGGDLSRREDIAGLRSYLNANGAKKALLNFREVLAVGPWGLGLLVSEFAIHKMNGGQFKLCCPTERVRGTLEFFKLNLVIEVFDDETTALASFAASSTDSGWEAGNRHPGPGSHRRW